MTRTAGVAFALFAGVVACFAALIPLGHWQDEFLRFQDSGLQARGLASYVARLLEWSPRPFSEILVVAYGKGVLATREPLVGTALSVPWAALAVGLLATPMLVARGAASPPPTPNRILVALCLFCLFLLGHPVSEMFYWPMAALAYLVSMAAICALFWSVALAGSESRSARSTAAILMLIAATSVEAGAIFVAAFCAIAIVARSTSGQRSTADRRPLLWLALPLSVSLAVIVAIYAGRVAQAREVLGDPVVAHHVLPVLVKAVPIFFGEMMAIDGREIGVRSIATGLATKALFAAGVFALFRLRAAQVPPSRKRLLGVLSIACFVSGFVILCASLYHFGSACCERQKTYRLCLEFLGVAAAAALAAMAYRPQHTPRWLDGRSAIPIGCLLLSVLIAVLETAPRLAHDYRNYRPFLDAAAQTWTDGTGPGETMTFRQARGAVVGGELRPDGTYAADDPDWWVRSVMQFFGKRSVRFVTVGG